jgi:methylenetetrahydrofolate dehydrogenase (NADP+) / methenyltetrahydrofolate cyclohydrolase
METSNSSGPLILSGKEIAAKVKTEVAEEVTAFKNEYGYVPGLAIIMVGSDPSIQSYVNAVLKSFETVGMANKLLSLPEDVDAETLQQTIRGLNQDPKVSAIIVGQPLPKHLPLTAVTDVLSPEKDIDGITPVNAGKFLLEKSAGESDYFVAATPMGGMELMRRYNVDFAGKRAVVVGRSPVVGKPMAMLLLQENATVTICHSRTKNIGEVIREADIVAAAAGKANMITKDMVKPGAIVVDFGINFVDGKLVGDVDFQGVKEVAAAITPVPGGTGPMTNVVLLKNALKAAKMLAG